MPDALMKVGLEPDVEDGVWKLQANRYLRHPVCYPGAMLTSV